MKFFAGALAALMMSIAATPSALAHGYDRAPAVIVAEQEPCDNDSEVVYQPEWRWEPARYGYAERGRTSRWQDARAARRAYYERLRWQREHAGWRHGYPRGWGYGR